jgi:acyl-coenzyme A synthetase/AMP-(fatty) acid ligase
MTPDELEDILLQHEAVAEACVFGIEHELGATPRAVVVLRPDKTASAEEIQAFVDGEYLKAYILAFSN